MARRYIRTGQELFHGWSQIGAALGLSPEWVRKTWKERGLPIWFERGRPVTSRALLADYSRKRIKEDRKSERKRR
jgi:hypothetical protein